LFHQVEAVDQEPRVVVRRRDVKSPVCTPIGIRDEVGEGFMEGPNRVIDVVMEDEEGTS
jgi:hypothetical protein